MQNILKSEIKRLSKRAFDRSARAESLAEHYRKQFEKRTGAVAGIPKSRVKPMAHRHFDPKYCMRNANFLAKTIWHKVLENTYEPIPAINYEIPKPDGGVRSIMAFSIPDAALANVILKRSRGRNLKRLSPSSFAYHPEKNVFDAILALKDFDYQSKLFAVQIDFEKYFDNIPTWYLQNRIHKAKEISLTPHEKYVYKEFLCHKYANPTDYKAGNFSRRAKGTPQGSSVSLLLANLANHELDVALDSRAGKFVRFADDVLALCSSYQQALDIENCFVDHCSRSGLTLNTKKSPGIGIISSKQEEMRTYKHFDYLGYRFTSKGLSIPEKVEKRIKSKCSRLINIYLIQYPKKHAFDKNRCSSASAVIKFDWDLLGLIHELRGYIYGGLQEDQLWDFILKGRKLPKMRGLMGFYCLIDDQKALNKLDGWLLSIVRRAIVERCNILQKHGHSCPMPSNKALATGTWLDPNAWRGQNVPDARMPSFKTGWRAAKKYFYTFGLESVEAPSYLFYDFSKVDISEYF